MSDITENNINSINICASMRNLKPATAMKAVQHKRNVSNMVQPPKIICRVNSPAIISP